MLRLKKNLCVNKTLFNVVYSQNNMLLIRRNWSFFVFCDFPR